MDKINKINNQNNKRPSQKNKLKKSPYLKNKINLWKADNKLANKNKNPQEFL